MAEVTKAVGLTYGGFYGHFASKDDLIAQTVAHALSEDQNSDIFDERAAMAEGLAAQIARLTATLQSEGVRDARGAAIGCWSAAVGAMITARAIKDPALSDDILAQSDAWISASF